MYEFLFTKIQYLGGNYDEKINSTTHGACTYVFCGCLRRR